MTLNSSMATGLDEISCTATAIDSYGAVDSQSISMFVDETIPVFPPLRRFLPANSGVFINTALTCLGTASDPDGTSVTLMPTDHGDHTSFYILRAGLVDDQCTAWGHRTMQHYGHRRGWGASCLFCERDRWERTSRDYSCDH